MNPTDTNPPTLLIVDDETGPRISLKIIFQDSYRILMADSGEVALDILRNNPVDVAILDILLGGITGTELLGKIKEFDPTVEVIMLTAYESLQTTREALRQGASDYLNKPFAVSTIREAVNAANKKRQISKTKNGALIELQTLREELNEQILAEKKTQNQSEIYANILHDIYNPLSVVTLYMDVLDQTFKEPKRFEEHKETLLNEMESIRTEVKHCFEISRRYLGYLRQCEDEADSANINHALIDLKNLLKPHSSLNANLLQIDLLPDDVDVAIHSIDLLQILLNLTTNALQCTPDKHEVRITTRLNVECRNSALL